MKTERECADIRELYTIKESTLRLRRLVSHGAPTKDLFMDPKFLLTVCKLYHVRELALNPNYSVRIAEFEGWRSFLEEQGCGDILKTRTDLPFVSSVRMLQIRSLKSGPIHQYLFENMAPRILRVKMPDGDINTLQGIISYHKQELYSLVKNNYSIRELIFCIETGPHLDSEATEIDTVIARNKAIFQRRQQTACILLGLARFRKLPVNFERNILRDIAVQAWAADPKIIEGLL